jgi:[citrate (pro-3S)-lyase] ligase
MIAKLIAPADVAAARRLIEGCDLAFQPGYDDLLGVHEQGSLVAVGARAGRVLKMLAIAPDYRGGSLLGEIVSALVACGIEAGLDSLFVFTKPAYAASFEALNFTRLAAQQQAVLLEFGNGFKHWLAARDTSGRTACNGALTVDGEPFSRRQRLLIEDAASRVDRLYLFVSAADPSPVPFPERWRQLRDGVRDLAKVVVLDLAHYRIGAATFPTYFLKPDDPVATIRVELDATLFATRIAPFFGIARYFTGAEPGADHAVAARVIQAHGIEVSAISNPPPGDRQ